MSSIWLPLCLLIYAAITLLWARLGAMQNSAEGGFFSAGHALSPWVTAIVMAGISLPGWLLLSGTQHIAEAGLQLPTLLVAGVVIALPGCVFFKRIWLASMRLRVSSLAGLFGAYFSSPFLVIATTATAFLFAIGFAGVQLRAGGLLIASLTDGALDPVVVSTVIGFLLFAGVGIGGLRSAAYLGVLQTIFLISTLVLLTGLVLIELGGFAALNASLKSLSETDEASRLMTVQKVIQFTSGLGRGTDPALANSAIANFSLALALMGFQCGPVAMKLVTSTARPTGLAAGQTWVMVGTFGLLIVFALAIMGLAGLIDPDYSLGSLLAALHDQSPWFAGWSIIGVIAGVQVLAGLSIFVACESLIRDVYKPYFHAALSKQDAVTLVRIAIAIVILITVIMQLLAPITLSALAAIALPVSVQLASPLLGVTWARWITRPAAVCGVGFGVVAILLTEPLGHEILSAFGLDLPWGRWPWTVHSAVWGLVVNFAAVLIISAITNRQAMTGEAQSVHDLYAKSLPSNPAGQSLRPVAWSLVLAWFFLAVGPGLIFGNFAFSAEAGDGVTWLFGIPSLWAWSMGGWLWGLGLIWFLSYKMGLASPVHVSVSAFEPAPRLTLDTSQQERERMRRILIATTIGAALITFTIFSFGG